VHKSKLINGVYEKIRIIENWKDHKRLYVKRTRLKTYVVSTSEKLTLDSMVEINGEYHFDTLPQLHNALNS